MAATRPAPMAWAGMLLDLRRAGGPHWFPPRVEAKGQPQARIVLRRGPDEIGRYVIDPGDYLINADAPCPVRANVPGADARESQVRLTFDGEQVRVEPTRQASRTWIDGEPLRHAACLRPHQKVQLGETNLEISLLRKLEEAIDSDSKDSSGPIPPGTSSDDTPEKLPKYQVKEEVTRGGMGTILRATDCQIERTVAMKVIVDAKADSPEHRSRFVREAQVTGQLEHPNIIPVHELGADERGRPFYTMKYVKGITLEEVLGRIRAGNEPAIREYPLTHLLTIFQKICDAVAFAHSRQILHRDLKPENIMIGDYGEVLVMDWGLAKLIGDSASAAGEGVGETTPGPSSTALNTVVGRVIGTPSFMAPEQARGQVDRIDERTDIYSLGAILYHILALQPPVTGHSAMEVIERVKAGDVRPPTSVHPEAISPHCPGGQIPAALSAVAMKALAMEPANRYPSVKDLQRDIAAYQGGFITSAEEQNALKLLWLLIKRHKVESIALVLIAALTMVTLVSIAIYSRRDRFLVSELNRTDPRYRDFYPQAISLVKERKFDEALREITYAIAVSPGEADFHNLQGHIYQSLRQLRPARDSYTAALKLNPKHASARENLVLCDTLLARNPGGDPLTDAALGELQDAMRRQGRFEEAVALLDHMRPDPQRVFETWRDVLAESGLGDRLRRNDAGELGLDLASTPIRDLTLLEGMPLTSLNLARTAIFDLAPLKGMPLKELRLDGCGELYDLSPLKDCDHLERLTIPSQCRELEVLRTLPNLKQLSTQFPGDDWSAVQSAQAFWAEQARATATEVRP